MRVDGSADFERFCSQKIAPFFLSRGGNFVKMTIKDFAEMAGTTERTIQRWFAEGMPGVVRHGKGKAAEIDARLAMPWAMRRARQGEAPTHNSSSWSREEFNHWVGDLLWFRAAVITLLDRKTVNRCDRLADKLHAKAKAGEFG